MTNMTPLDAPLTCFKAYDVRGRLDEDLTEENVARIGRAFVEVMGARQVVTGRDVRPSSGELSRALAKGLMAGGAEVMDLGLCGTEEVYFAVSHRDACGGLCVTASHNPIEYNGLKMVGPGSTPLDPVSGMAAIKDLAEKGAFAEPARRGGLTDISATRQAYVERMLSFVETGTLKPLKILANPGNGAAGPTFDAIATALKNAGVPWEFERINHDPDGTFPKGIPNPLLPEFHPATGQAVRAAGADFGVAWDGDFDRCFFFDHDGAFVPGEYVVGLLAQQFLTRHKGEKIVHDQRVIWNTRDVVETAGGTAILARCGHTFQKRALRECGAIYGGEVSAHHYFRDFFFCDSGMIPWLLIGALLGQTGRSLKDLVERRRKKFPSSGEINFSVTEPSAVISHVEAQLAGLAELIDHKDGLSLSFEDWRLNLRASNTEPLLRLNVETRGCTDLLDQKLTEIRELIRSGGKCSKR